VIIVIIAAILIGTTYYRTYEVTGKVIGKHSKIVSTTDDDGTHISTEFTITVEGHGTFVVERPLWAREYESNRDFIYDYVQEGEVYTFICYGWRIEPFSVPRIQQVVP